MTSTADAAAAVQGAIQSSQVARALKTREAAITLIVLLVVAVFQFGELSPVPQLQNWIFDSYQQLRPRARISAPAILVEIDDKSLSELGQWPWPRTRIADLIDRIAAYEPAAIGLEVFFPEPDRLSPDRFAVSLEQRSPELAARLRSYPSNDSILAHAILRHHVVLPIAGLGRPSPNLESFAHFRAKHEVMYSPRNLPLRRYVGVLQAIDEIQEAAAGRGLASVELGSDNVLRNVPLIALIGDIPVATFTLELLRVATNSTINAVQSSEGIVDVQLGSRAVAKAQANGEMRIRFGHRMEGLFISAADVLAGRVDRARLNGKLVVVGVTALGLAGQVTTPLGVQMSGSEIYVQLIEQLLDNTPLYRTEHSRYWETLAFVAIGFALAIVARYFSMVIAFVVLLACTAGAGILGVFLFSRGILIDVATPVAGWQLAFGCALATSLMVARKAHRKAVHMFSRFVDPRVVEDILRDDSLLAKAGQSRELTILFSDIRNFTALSERRSPAEVVSLLNEYFSRQTDVVFLHKGTLDKFMGDGVMAFWGAPLGDAEHAQHAISCALDMAKAFDSFLGDMGLRDQGLDIGIGVHTGRTVVGLVGTDARREYTAIGAAVNLASRIEQLTKVTKRRVLASRETMEKCSNAFVFEHVGSFSVRGVERQVDVYEPRPKGVELTT